MTGPVRWKSEANVNTLGTPDQGAPRGAQQTQPSDEELAQIAENLKKEAADKEKDKKKEGSDGNKPKGAGGGDDESSDDSDGAGLDDGLSDDDDGGESDDSSETDDASDDDSGDEDEDSEEDESESDESEENEEEGTEDDEGEGETDDGDDDSEEGEGDSEEGEDEGDDDSEVDGDYSEEGDDDEEEGEEEGDDDEEATAGAVGQKRIFRGEASSYAAMHILSAFPGCGKSHLFASPSKLLISDSDSSLFDKTEFPYNYVDHIQEKHLVNDLCLVSSHAEVRAEMKQRNLRYTLVYPARSCKPEYLARYARRGSPAAFIEMMDKQWDDFLDSCEADDAPSIVLQPGQYLSDVIGRLDD